MIKAVLMSAAAGALVLSAPAYADPPGHAPAHGYYKSKHKKAKRAYRSGYAAGWDDAQPINRDTRIWRGDDGRYRCRRDNGTTGLIIGGAVGGLIGNEVAGRGDKLLGTILGAAGGAILGRSIDRSKYRCR